MDEGPGYWGRGGTASAMAIVTSTLMTDHEIYVPPKLVGATVNQNPPTQHPLDAHSYSVVDEG